MSFIDDRHVAIAWISPDTAKENAQKEPIPSDAAHVHVVVVDSTTGRKESEKQWPTPFSYASPTMASRTGNFLICTDDAMRLLSVTLDTLREKGLPSDSSCSPSPSGRTVLVVSLSKNDRQLKIVDTDTFEVLSSWTEQRQTGAETIAVSDHWLLGYCGEPTELCVRHFDEGWRPLHVPSVETRTTERHRIPASFINDEVLALRGKVTTLATIDGAMLYQILPAERQLFGRPPISSLDGDHFVIVEGRLRGMKSEPLDIYPFFTEDQAAVYGIKDHRSEFSLKLRSTSPWKPGHVIENVFALSADGASLAVISDGVLQVFAIPARSAERR